MQNKNSHPDHHNPGHKTPQEAGSKAAYAEDAGRTQAYVNQLEAHPIIKDDRTYRFAGMWPLPKGNVLLPILEELERRGLSAPEAMEPENEGSIKFKKIYVDERLDPAVFREIATTINDAIRVASVDQPSDLQQIAGNVLDGGNFPEAAAISAEHLSHPTEQA